MLIYRNHWYIIVCAYFMKLLPSLVPYFHVSLGGFSTQKMSRTSTNAMGLGHSAVRRAAGRESRGKQTLKLGLICP